MINKQISTRYLENGVIFQSHKYPYVSYGTTYEEDGKIWHNISFEPETRTLPQKLINRNNLGVVAFDMLFIAIAISTGNSVLISSSIVFSIFLSFQLNKLARKKFSKASKFHAAKHKVFNAWKSLNYERVPSLEEVKKASHFSNECSDNDLLRNCIFELTLLIILILTYNNNILFWILAIFI